VSQVLRTRTQLVQVLPCTAFHLSSSLFQVLGSATANYFEAGAEIINAVVNLILKARSQMASAASS
jgi:hypothetical protein